MRLSKWHVLMGVFAFASVISFFNINSAYGDDHHFNGVFGFLGIGIVFALAAIYILIFKLMKYGGGGGGASDQ